MIFTVAIFILTVILVCTPERQPPLNETPVQDWIGGYRDIRGLRIQSQWHTVSLRPAIKKGIAFVGFTLGAEL